MPDGGGLSEVKCSEKLALKPSGIFLCIGSHDRRGTRRNQTLGCFSYHLAIAGICMPAMNYPRCRLPYSQLVTKGCKSMGHLFFSARKEIPHRERIKAIICGSASAERLAGSKGEIPPCALSNRKTNPLSVSACCLACLSIIARLQNLKTKTGTNFFTLSKILNNKHII